MTNTANALGLFAPVLTIILYASLARLRGEALDVETAFTSVAILAMITHPANMIMTFVPQAVVSFSSFERIQAYLLGDGPRSSPIVISNSSGDHTFERRDSIAIGFEYAAITGSDTSKPVLQNINVKVPQGTVVVFTGPVGSGKTTLVRALLGEASCIQGSIRISSRRMAYCSQVPWLPNQTIRDIIHGPGGGQHRDQAWYSRTIEACCLNPDLDTLADGDLTPVGSGGMRLSGGQRQRVALARAVYSRCDIVIFDDSFSALDGKTQAKVIENLLGPHGLLRSLEATVVWISTATRYFHLADDIVVLAEGTVKERGTWEQLRKDAPLVHEIIHAVHQSPPGHALESPKRNIEPPRPAATAIQKDFLRKDGDLSLYAYYARSAGLPNILVMILGNVLYGIFNTTPPYWLKLWTESPSTSSDTLFFATGYATLLLLAWLAICSSMYSTTMRIAPSSGLTLHARLLKAVVSAPLPFFASTDVGALLNRFGSDVQLVDAQLAPAALSLGAQTAKLAAQIAVLLLVSSTPLLGLFLPPSVVLVYAVQRVYLRTSRQLRLLELEARAGVVSDFVECVGGATTARAFGWGTEMARQGCTTLDRSQRPMYLLLCLQRWLKIVLDLLVAAVATATIAMAVVYRGSTTAGQVGVALNVILVTNVTLLRLVESWTGLEISLGAVARLREVEADTPCEEGRRGGEEVLPPGDWPSKGVIEFEGISAAYQAEAVALRDVRLSIEAGQTVVVCGRTGSGKSSLLLSLLRLLDVTEGRITIDGVDTAQLPRSALRGRAFITVAQDAFFLPHFSLRVNLDPELEAPASVIVFALKRTGLWDEFCVGALSEEWGVILPSALGSFPVLSTGQCQLLALTRALVRKWILCTPSRYVDSHPEKPIILLDEVTSSLDPETEGRIYGIVREDFVEAGHTVVMVTHKLDGFRTRLRKGRDTVLWMAEGRVERIEVVGDGEERL